MQTAAPLRRSLAALFLVLALLLAALPRASAAGLQNLSGIQLLSFDANQILSIGNQAPGQCSLYALRYARTVLDGTPVPAPGCGREAPFGRRPATPAFRETFPPASTKSTPSWRRAIR